MNTNELQENQLQFLHSPIDFSIYGGTMSTNELLKQLRELRMLANDQAYDVLLRQLNYLIRELETSLGYQPIRFDD